MAESSYDMECNGDGPDDFKRNSSGTVSGNNNNHNNDCSISVKSEDTEEDPESKTSEKVNEYLRELLSERNSIDSNKLSHAERLLDQEITKVQTTGRIPHREAKYVDIYREKQIRVVVKVLVPVKEHPKFNFVGKLLGPKGNSMKHLQEETMCRMAVLGRGSMKDRKKEEELRNSSDLKYSHLNDELHVEISALASPAEAHARAAYALAEVRKYLIPDSNDHIRQEQLRELIADGSIPSEDNEPRYAKPQRGGGGGPPQRSFVAPRTYPSSHGYGHPRSAPPPRSPAVGPGGGVRGNMPAKQKVMSILDRARVAMDESYGYEDDAYNATPPPPPPHFEPYSSGYGHGHGGPPSRNPRYDGGGGGNGDYEAAPEYRRDYYHREATSYPVKSSHQQVSSGGGPAWKAPRGGGGAGGRTHGGFVGGHHAASHRNHHPHNHHHHQHDDEAAGGGNYHQHGGHNLSQRGGPGADHRYRNAPYSRPPKHITPIPPHPFA